jgi:hypothetical protein
MGVPCCASRCARRTSWSVTTGRVSRTAAITCSYGDRASCNALNNTSMGTRCSISSQQQRRRLPDQPVAQFGLSCSGAQPHGAAPPHRFALHRRQRGLIASAALRTSAAFQERSRPVARRRPSSTDSPATNRSPCIRAALHGRWSVDILQLNLGETVGQQIRCLDQPLRIPVSTSPERRPDGAEFLCLHMHLYFGVVALSTRYTKPFGALST